MNLNHDQIDQLKNLGLNPTSISQKPQKINLLPLFSISGITLLSLSGLILLKSKNSPDSTPSINSTTQPSNQINSQPTQVPKSIQHYLLASQQYFSQAIEAQTAKSDNQTIINYLNGSIIAASNAIKISPSDYRGYEQRAKIYQSLLDTQPQFITSAIADYQQAQQLNQNSAEITRQLASLYAKNGDLQNTLLYLSATVTLEPTKAQNFYDLARLQQQAGLLPDALNTYNQLLPLITDSSQKSQLEIEKKSLEKIISQNNLASPNSSVNEKNHLSSPTPFTLQTEGNLLQASSSTALIIAAPETLKNISLENQTDSNSLSGTAILPSGQKEIVIENSRLTPSSQVYLSLISGGKNQTLEILSKTSSSFTAGFREALPENVTFKWWIVNP